MSITKMIAAAILTFAGTLGIANATTLSEAGASIHRLHIGPYNGFTGTSDRFTCSGVAVSPTQLVTAAHCIAKVPDDRKLAVAFEDMFEGEFLSRVLYSVKTLRVDYANDTAFLEVKSPDFSFDYYVNIAEEYTPTMGAEMYALGYPRGDVLTLTQGMFTQTTWLDAGSFKGYYYKSTIPVTGGSSGGGAFIRDWDPVLKDWTYTLVGLTSAGYPDVSFQNYFSTLESLHKITKSLLTLPGQQPTEGIIPYNDMSDESLLNHLIEEK